MPEEYITPDPLWVIQSLVYEREEDDINEEGYLTISNLWTSWNPLSGYLSLLQWMNNSLSVDTSSHFAVVSLLDPVKNENSLSAFNE